MKITDSTVVQFHYTLTNQAGEQVESSRDGDPVAYLHGHKNMIVGVEKALADKEQGDSFSVTVTPEEGYGERQEDAVQRVPTKHLQGAKCGSQVWLQPFTRSKVNVKSALLKLASLWWRLTSITHLQDKHWLLILMWLMSAKRPKKKCLTATRTVLAATSTNAQI